MKPHTQKIVGIGIGVFLLASILIVRLNTAQRPSACTSGSVPVTERPAELVGAQDYFAQGDFDYERGECDLAISDYSRAIELDPNFAEAYNNRAYTYMVQHNYAAALPDLDKAIELRPGYVNALMNRGDIYNYYYHINYDRAIADYDRALKLGAAHNSVCGHRLLALHHGWDANVFVEVFFVNGVESGCVDARPVN